MWQSQYSGTICCCEQRTSKTDDAHQTRGKRDFASFWSHRGTNYITFNRNHWHALQSLITMPLPGIPEFFSWFQSHGGYIDTSAFDIVTFPPSEGGRGAIALKDIPVGPKRRIVIRFLKKLIIYRKC